MCVKYFSTGFSGSGGEIIRFGGQCSYWVDVNNIPRQLWHERFLHICSDLHGISFSCGAQSFNTSKTRHNTEKCVFSDTPSYFHKVEDKIEVLFTPDTSSAWIVHHYGFDEWTVVFVLLFDCETTQIAAKHHGAVLNHRDSKMSLVGGRWNVRNVFRQKTQTSLLCWWKYPGSFYTSCFILQNINRDSKSWMKEKIQDKQLFCINNPVNNSQKKMYGSDFLCYFSISLLWLIIYHSIIYDNVELKLKKHKCIMYIYYYLEAQTEQIYAIWCNYWKLYSQKD